MMTTMKASRVNSGARNGWVSNIGGDQPQEDEQERHQGRQPVGRLLQAATERPAGVPLSRQ
ncbi:hypothetical protein [Amorphus coralli]|uniref:hypothetical protein n=1 Tax=Amorphus coralli TaxID=340680 RepID=UPI0003669B91|nr:hypothetical protein [Amorphus coralli]